MSVDYYFNLIVRFQKQPYMICVFLKDLLNGMLKEPFEPIV